jgi:hypothetical protein
MNKQLSTYCNECKLFQKINKDDISLEKINGLFLIETKCDICNCTSTKRNVMIEYNNIDDNTCYVTNIKGFNIVDYLYDNIKNIRSYNLLFKQKDTDNDLMVFCFTCKSYEKIDDCICLKKQNNLMMMTTTCLKCGVSNKRYKIEIDIPEINSLGQRWCYINKIKNEKIYDMFVKNKDKVKVQSSNNNIFTI